MGSKQLEINRKLVKSEVLHRIREHLVITEMDLRVALTDNHDLPRLFVREVLEADLERKQGLLSEYSFG